MVLGLGGEIHCQHRLTIDGTGDRDAVTVMKNRRDPWTITSSNGCRISCRFPLETSADVVVGDVQY
jgi:hypothetical protein